MKIELIASSVRRLALFLLLFCPFLWPFDWPYDPSLRIKAIGEDLAGILPDAETDIMVRNPSYLADYRAFIFRYRGYHYYWEMPFNATLFYGPLGFSFKYGSTYYVTKEEPKKESRLLDLTGYFGKTTKGFFYNFYDEVRERKTSSESYRSVFLYNRLLFGFKKNLWDFRLNFGLAYYDSTIKPLGKLSPIHKTRFFLPAIKLGFTYERPIGQEAGLVFLADFGTPTSWYELKTLPIPLLETIRRKDGRAQEWNLQANTLVWRVCPAFFNTFDHSLTLAFGINDYGTFARGETGPTKDIFINILHLPFGFEKWITEYFSFRGGILIEKYWLRSHQKSGEIYITSYWAFFQTLGLGFEIGDRLFIDLYNRWNISDITAWSLLVRKEF